MQAKPQTYDRTRKTHAIVITIAAGLSSAGLVTALILFCYRSSHLHM